MILLSLLGIFFFTLSAGYCMEGSNKSDSPSSLPAPYKQIHESDCLIKCYTGKKDKSLSSIYTGTYMVTPDTAKPFILTTGHIDPCDYMSVSFNTGIEYEMVGYTSLITKFTPHLNHAPLSRFLACFAGIDMGIGFIPSYDGPIKPAHFLPQDCPKSQQQRSDYLKNIKDLPCSLSGFGDNVVTLRNHTYTLIYKNEDYAQTLITLKVNARLAFTNPISKSKSYLETHKDSIKGNLDIFLDDVPSYYLDAHYQRPHTCQATPYEQPLREGFSGASLRTIDGYVIGVASCLETGFLNEWATQHSSALHFLSYSYDSAYIFFKELYSYKPILFMAFLFRNYYAFDEQIIPAFMVTALSFSLMIHCLEKIHSFYSYGAILQGARSFFSPTLLWEPLIIQHVNLHDTKS